MIALTFNLNGADVALQVAPERRLLDILREDMQLTGAKPGCGIGRCGACMVWLDGLPMNACLLMAFQLQDRRVTTIEAVARDPASAPVRAAMANCGGVQCGYCSAGMVMTLTHLHQRTPRPDAREAAALTCGNLCRCTGYGGIQRALDELFTTTREMT
ncbi:MAG: (2Fe-2S)-binding protein [Herbaspirillum sp.]|jgi:carbon-monoxide dehydrogenase small subunit|nr:(2Fe-2S)-binding protein [Herbaspirillum sp.]